MKYREKNSNKTKNLNYGTLYVVSTPIGNLEDITLRALKILKNVDLIAAENTKHTRGLCNHYGIKKRLISYNQHNRKSRAPELTGRLKSGYNIALVTSAGTPAISDPGTLVIDMALEEGIRVSPIPGPSAAIAALSVCGIRLDNFLFLGFLSNRSSKRRKELKELAHENRTMVFFEAPHRVKSTLEDLVEILGDRYVIMLRELTKIYEEVLRGTVSSLLKRLDENRIKGEFTIVVAGKKGEKNGDFLDIRTKNRLRRLIQQNNMGVKDIAIKLSRELDLNYRMVYKECIAIKKQIKQH